MALNGFRQTTLDSFVISIPRAVGSLNGKSSKSLGSLFLKLPAEIRCMTYQALFQNAMLKISVADLDVATSKGKPPSKTINVEKILEMIQENKAALLRASEFCKREGVCILASCTTVEIGDGIEERQNVFAAIDKTFLRHIQRLHVHPNSFIRADRNSVPRLRDVTFKLCLPDHYSSDLDLLDVLYSPCAYPGDLELIYKFMVIDIDDWNWKRQQLCRLAMENAWTIRLVICANIVCDCGADIDANFEVEHNIKDEQRTAVRLILHNETVLTDADFEKKEQCEEVRKIAYSLDCGTAECEDI